jgi:hypothetical protein
MWHVFDKCWMCLHRLVMKRCILLQLRAFGESMLVLFRSSLVITRLLYPSHAPPSLGSSTNIALTAPQRLILDRQTARKILIALHKILFSRVNPLFKRIQLTWWPAASLPLLCVYMTRELRSWRLQILLRTQPKLPMFCLSYSLILPNVWYRNASSNN